MSMINTPSDTAICCIRSTCLSLLGAVVMDSENRKKSRKNFAAPDLIMLIYQYARANITRSLDGAPENMHLPSS